MHDDENGRQAKQNCFKERPANLDRFLDAKYASADLDTYKRKLRASQSEYIKRRFSKMRSISERSKVREFRKMRTKVRRIFLNCLTCGRVGVQKYPRNA